MPSNEHVVLAIDPGTTRSGWVLVRGDPPGPPVLLDFGLTPNEEMLLDKIPSITACCDCLVYIEMIASYGMPVGKEVFETCVWIGRFWESVQYPACVSLVYRREVKLELCGTTKAKDANIRQAIIDRYPPVGGGKLPQVGIKKKPGPLFGVSGDIWAALGVGITAFKLKDSRAPAEIAMRRETH